jgi:hypothetical protein
MTTGFSKYSVMYSGKHQASKKLYVITSKKPRDGTGLWSIAGDTSVNKKTAVKQRLINQDKYLVNKC